MIDEINDSLHNKDSFLFGKDDNYDSHLYFEKIEFPYTNVEKKLNYANISFKEDNIIESNNKEKNKIIFNIKKSKLKKKKEINKEDRLKKKQNVEEN